MKRGTPRHPKVFALAANLQIQHPTAVGIIEMLWHFAAEHCPQGNIGAIPDREIANAVGWEGKPARLLLGLQQEGFLDIDPEHRLIVHDWPQHCEYEVCRKLLRNKKDFLAVYGVSARDRRGDNALPTRQERVNNAPSREAMAIGVSSNGFIKEKGSPEGEASGAGSFLLFWERYRKLRDAGRMQITAQMWLSFGCEEHAAEILACLSNYEASRDVASGAVQNGDLWLRTVRDSGWTATWPAVATKKTRLQGIMDSL